VSDQPVSVTPVGWYDDPRTSLHLRWWNGLDWTEHIAPLPEILLDPAGAEHSPGAEHPVAGEGPNRPQPCPLAPAPPLAWAGTTEPVHKHPDIPRGWSTASVWLAALRRRWRPGS
jgi:hypothetical protein